jgi:Kef-type K+ transport system membrane component KefB
VLPFLASMGVCVLLYQTYYDPAVLAFPPFAIFTALAMSVTGFPVLTRILAEKQLLGTEIGQITMRVAKLDDMITWILLLFVIPFITNTSNYGKYFLIFFNFALQYEETHTTMKH